MSTACPSTGQVGSNASTSNGTTEKRVRVQGELPPFARVNPSEHPDAEDADDDDDDGGESSGAESEGPAEPINAGEGSGLANVILEREFEDKKKRAENATGGDDAEGKIQELEPEDADLLAEYPDDTEELELTHSRLRSLTPLHLERFSKTLKRLSLRQNLLTSLVLTHTADNDTGRSYSPLESLTDLEDLDLYDNRLSSVKGLKGLTKLTSLDLSFNLLRKVPASQLQSMSRLKMLYFIQNKISKIEGLECIASTLESVEFGGNKLRKIENLDSCTSLTELWFGKNKITRLEGISTLRNLKILSIQSNRIVRLEGLAELESLEELYISHNGIKVLEGLERNHKLRVLDIGNNFISKLENIAHLACLEELWANNNMLSSYQEVDTQLANMKDLDTVYFEGNPMQKEAGANYRRKLMLSLPQVNQIDATYVHRR